MDAAGGRRSLTAAAVRAVTSAVRTVTSAGGTGPSAAATLGLGARR